MTASPVDRVHFLEEQHRNRRRSLRFSVFAVIAVAVAGIPLCVLVAPLLLGVILVAVHLLDLVLSVPPAWWQWLHAVVFALPDMWNRILGGPVEVPWTALAVVYIAPGAVLMLLSWPFITRLSRRAGAGTILHRLSSREVNPAEWAERQLANVVQEMAVAAGVQPPAVRIIESAVVNAVAVGLTTDDAVILATTGFLRRMDRDQRQAVVAHLMGSVGNGDLEIAAIILSVFGTWGLVALLLESPIHARARAQVREFLRLSAAAWRGPVDPEEARQVLDPLLSGASFDIDSLIDGIESIGPRSVLHGCFILLVQLPVIATLGLASIAARQAIALFTALGLGPWLAAMWRARRRLADATAVQLTRNPAALARAVRDFETSDVEVPGGWVAYFLFPVWPPITDQSAARETAAAANVVGMRLEPAPRLERLAALGANLEAGIIVRRTGLARLREALPDWKDLRTAVMWGFLAVVGSVVLIAISLAAASLLLMALWWILGVLRTED